MSVRHHKQLVPLHQREQHLQIALQECTNALQKCVQLLVDDEGEIVEPIDVLMTAKKFFPSPGSP